jgi:Putative prokaryotic signal transducing protein
MRRLYEAADRIEAQCLLDLLLYHHIEAVVLGDYLSGAAGELPTNLFPSVWVVEGRDWPAAQALLRDFLAPVQATDGAWSCPACRETVEGAFQVCWNCGTARCRE